MRPWQASTRHIQPLPGSSSSHPAYPCYEAKQRQLSLPLFRCSRRSLDRPRARACPPTTPFVPIFSTIPSSSCSHYLKQPFTIAAERPPWPAPLNLETRRPRLRRSPTACCVSPTTSPFSLRLSTLSPCCRPVLRPASRQSLSTPRTERVPRSLSRSSPSDVSAVILSRLPADNPLVLTRWACSCTARLPPPPPLGLSFHHGTPGALPAGRGADPRTRPYRFLSSFHGG